MSARSWTQFIAVVLIWSTTWIIIKDQLGVVAPAWSVTYRFWIGGAGLIGWCIFRGMPLSVPRRGWGFVAGVALFQFVLNFNLVYRSELYITSGLLAVAFALLMVPNALFARLFLKRPIGARFALGSALGIIGVLLLFAQQLTFAANREETLLGLALVLAAVLCASVANVMQATPLARELPWLPTLGWAMLLGATVNGLVAWLSVGPPSWDPRPQYLAGLLMLGLVASALAFAVYFDLIRTIGPAEAAWTGVPIPIIAMAISTLFEGYRWTPLAALGTALALIGLIVALRQPSPKPAPA